MKVKNWKDTLKDKYDWEKYFKESKVCTGMLCHLRMRRRKKGKVVLVHATKAYGGRRRIDLFILPRHCMEVVVSFTSRPFYPRERTPVSTGGREHPNSRSGRFGEGKYRLPLPGLEPRIYEAVA